MNSPHSSDAGVLSRRDAIKRTAVLLGLALSPAMLDGVLHAQASTPFSVSQPNALLPAQFATLAAIAERILPRTDTPGATDVHVAEFIDRMLAAYVTPGEKATIVAGLEDIDATSRRQHRTSFAQLSSAQQDELLRDVARAAQAREKTFFHLVKDLTLIGYFTSETVGRNVLHYDPIPGRYQGCIPLADVGNRAWTR